ncbi:MAG: YceI family protein [Pseudomonadota bacterium]
MKKMIVLVSLLASLVLFANIVYAEPSEWQLDQVHSRIFFDIKHIFAIVRGQFDDMSATLKFDPNNVKDSRCDMEVRIKSINTNIQKRDEHLLSDDFFSGAKFPVMKFKTMEVGHMKNNQFQLKGKLTIKDVTQDVVIPVIYLGEKEHPADPKKLVCGFEGKFTIDRLLYHVGTGKYYKMGAIGKDVDIIISIEAIKDK